jgi:hypothetical protein
MNERIKEIAVEARLLTGWPVGEVEYQKFAELLIQKCVDISDDYVKDCTCEEHVNCKHPRSAIGRKIREYFDA